MAIKPDDDKELGSQNQNNPSQDVGGGVSGDVSGAGGGGGAAAATTGQGTAGGGLPGGQGGWTNIQQYLNANQGSAGSSDAIKNTVGGAITKADQDLTTQTQTAKDAADKQAASAKVGVDQASKLIQQGQGNQLKQAWQGSPTGQFAYAAPSQVTDWGNQAKAGNEQGWNTLLNTVYDQSGAMGTGARALQNNLDRNNPAVQAARQQVADQSTAFQNRIPGAIQDVNNTVTNAYNTYGKNQNNTDRGLRDMYSKQAGQVGQGLEAAPGFDQLAGYLGLPGSSAIPNTNVSPPPVSREGGVGSGPRTLNPTNVFNPPPPPPGPDTAWTPDSTGATGAPPAAQTPGIEQKPNLPGNPSTIGPQTKPWWQLW